MIRRAPDFARISAMSGARHRRRPEDAIQRRFPMPPATNKSRAGDFGDEIAF
jgi:hypothetical protein